VPAFGGFVARLPLPPREIVLSGQSYGGRVASLLAAQDQEYCAGVVCFSYPLHRPGAPDWQARSAHWPAIRVPLLLLSGESDPFARIDLLRRARDERAPAASLRTWPGLGHSLRTVLEEALDEVARFVRSLPSGDATAGPPESLAP
jgi:predicted alpha/beta-hydrolase family hydrolase